MSRFGWEPGRLAIGDFRRTWPQLLVLSVALRAAVSVLLLPSVALLVSFFVGRTGQVALSDQEILFFFLSPLGFFALLVIGAAVIGIGIAEQAGLMTIGYGATETVRVSWFGSLRYVARRFPALLELSGHVILRVLVYVVPAGAVIAALYLALLGDADINFYLANRPPKFLAVVALSGLALAIAGLMLGRRILGWAFAVQMVGFEGRRPTDSLRASEAAAAGHRGTLVAWFAVWLGAGLAVSGLVTIGVGWLGRVLIPWDAGSPALVAFMIGWIGLLSIGSNLVVSFLSSSLFALLLVRLYREYAGPGRLSDPITAQPGSLGDRARLQFTRKRLLLAVTGSLALAAVAAISIIERVPIEDHAIVIAHRGAAGAAPENSLASFERAIVDSTEYIELDVQEDADGRVVVFHDSDFMKVAGSPLTLWDATSGDLEVLDIGSWFDPSFAAERVPTLEEVLLSAKGRAHVMIELKYYGHDDDLERKVVGIVERTGSTDNVVVMSLKYDKVQKIKALRPNWTYGLLTSVSLGDATRFEVDYLAVNAETATRGLIRRAHAAGQDVYVWTVNDPLRMSAMISRGVDGIITDEPGLARRVLALRAELDPVQRLLVTIGSEVGFITVPTPDLDDADA